MYENINEVFRQLFVGIVAPVILILWLRFVYNWARRDERKRLDDAEKNRVKNVTF